MSIAGGLIRGLGRVGAEAAEQSAKSGLLSKLGQTFQQELVNSIPAGIMSGMYYGSQYSDDPVAAAGLIATDLLGSAALRVGTGALANKIFPGGVKTIVNPSTLKHSAVLGVKPGATKQQISDAVLDKVQAMKADIPNITADPKSPQYRQLQDIYNSGKALSSMSPSDHFIQKQVPSDMSNILGTAADIAFSMKGMGEIENSLINAGVITPGYMKGNNPGLIDQGSVVGQQQDNRVAQGVINNSVTSPGTLSQMSNIEIQRTMDELLAQARSERDALSEADLDAYVLPVA